MQTQKPPRQPAPPKQKLDTRGLTRWERELAEKQAASSRHGRKGSRCQTCRGKGQVRGITKSRGTGMGSVPGPCPECGGTGYIDSIDGNV
jgi:DnaJ-class molecular chaperone